MNEIDNNGSSRLDLFLVGVAKAVLLAF